MRRSPTRHGIRLALVAITAAVSLLASMAGTASAAPAATAVATENCWLQVVNDWVDNNRVDRTYAIPCYTQAIQHLNEYPDVQNYSSAADDIHRALLAVLRQDRGSGPGAGSDNSAGPSGPSSGPSGPSTPSGAPSGTPEKGTGFFRRAANWVGPSDAQSIPLPLLVLGGLALLLLVTAGATWLARRLQARRLPPAPAAKRP
jgi:hypothetical protein